MKRFTAVSLILLTLALIFSCTAEPENITERANLEITASEMKARTILPVSPDIKSYTVTLSGPESRSQTFSTSDTIQFSGILVGTYSIKVEGKTEDGTVVAEGSESISVRASGVNSAVIYLSYLTNGTGAMVIDISWEGRNIGSGPFDDALAEKSLGFQAVRTSDNTPYGEIQWADEKDFQNKRMTYKQSGLEPTDGTSIYFKIYTKTDGEAQVIARTFYTVVQIIANLTSVPDINEENNFQITDSSIIQYLKNVRRSSVTAAINEKNPETAVDISWEYPKLSNGNYSGKLTVKLLDSSNDSEIGSVTYEYTNETDRIGSHTFTGLSPENIYKVTFQNENDYGYSTVLTALDNIRSKIVVQGIAITSNVNEYYTMGDTVEITAEVTPDNATIRDYTISVFPQEGAEINGNMIRFISSGSYTITTTATDSVTDSHTDSRSTYVKLSTPEDFRASCTEEGIALSWNAVSSADGYVIERTVSDVEGNTQIEIDSVNTTSYVDISVYAGKTHTYTIRAVRNDNDKFNSVPSAEVSVTVDSADIEINNPPDITAQELPAISFVNQYLIDGAAKEDEHYSISISLNSAIEGASKYEWQLNNRIIASSDVFSSDVQNITITSETDGLDLSRPETENTLMLIVTVNGKTYSTTGKFYVVSAALTDIEITNPTDSNRVTLGTPLQLGVSFSPSIEDLQYTPSVSWSVVAGEDGVVNLSENGLVTAVDDGEVTIRVTANATGIYDEITIDTYIPAEYIEITNTTERDFMFMRKDGVTVENGYNEITLSAVAKRNDAKTISEEARAITWSVPEGTSNLSLSSTSGETITVSSVDKTSGGDVCITATNAFGLKESHTIHIHDVDLYIKESSESDYKLATNKTISTANASLSKNKTFNIKLDFNCPSSGNYHDAINLAWGFDKKEDNYDAGGVVGALILENPSGLGINLTRSGWNTVSPEVTAFIKSGSDTACYLSFTAKDI